MIIEVKPSTRSGAQEPGPRKNPVQHVSELTEDWMHFHKRVLDLLHQSAGWRGVDPPRQFTFCCSTRSTPLPHSISRDPNDPASGNGRNRANELFVAFPLWERPPTHCAHSTFRAPKWTGTKSSIPYGNASSASSVTHSVKREMHYWTSCPRHQPQCGVSL
jgi:hypothetical protein